ncbi:MAG: DUF4430 domain-containing protein [Clostridiales bacterium]|nr:DUF4430 domain-containing protein [Clostridiales bacterium]
MKRKFTIFLSFLCAVFCSVFCLFACEKSAGNVKASVVESSETLLVIRVDETDGEATLYDAMQYLQERGVITFETQSGAYGEMLKSINGKENGKNDNPCWLSYTTDETRSNTAWGYDYQGKTLGSCNYGVSSLTVETGNLYVWVYQSF